MAAAGSAVRSTNRLPLGFNVLRNDARAALALCAACGGSFIRVNVHTGAMLTDQGVIEGRAYETLRARRTLGPDTLIFADVQVKHAVPVAPMPIELSARDTLHRGLADALIVSGTGTGEAVNLEELRRVRQACPDAIVLLGSGVTRENIAQCKGLANGAIVGTSLKKDGKVQNPVEASRVRELVQVLKTV